MIYHRGVTAVIRRACTIVATFAVLLCALPARAETVPAGSVVRIDAGRRTIDVAAFARTIAMRYHVVLQRVITADIDRDGDLDVVAATDRGFLVWVNDGSGRLTSQTPDPKPGLDGGSPDDTWSGGRAHDDETIQNDSPSSRLSTAFAHAPPPTLSADFPVFRTACRSDVGLSAHIPRAPPLDIL